LLGYLASRIGGYSLTSFSLSLSGEPWKMIIGLVVGLGVIIYLWDKGMLIFSIMLGLLARLMVTTFHDSIGVTVGHWYLVFQPTITEVIQTCLEAFQYLSR
jgi:hypothetical protein